VIGRLSRHRLALAVGPALAAGCLLAAAAGGCAARGKSAVARPITGPAAWRLDQITPVPVLPAPATRPAEAEDDPPAEALLAFARARVERADGRRFAAVASLRQAAALDPYSYEVRYALGRALRAGVGFDPAATAEFERAAELEPDRVDVQVELARQYLAKGDAAEGLRRLRLAAQTTQYAADDDRAAEVDLLLGHTLADQRYDRAAVDRLERLVGRIDRGEVHWAEGGMAPRRPADDVPASGDRDPAAGDDPPAAEAWPVGRRGPRGGPGGLVGHVHVLLGDLYLRQDRPAAALAAYRRAEAAGGRDDPDVSGRLVVGLLASGRVDEGLRRAADEVVRFRGSGSSVTVLREAYKAVGRPGGAADALRQAHRRRPADLPVLFALCDVLAADDRAADGKPPPAGQPAARGRTTTKPPTTTARAAEAEGLLAAAWRRTAGDPAVLRRRVTLRLSAGDDRGAVGLVVDALADHPALAGQLEPTWEELFSPAYRGRMTPDLALTVPVPPGRAATRWQAARAYVAWAMAARWPRSAVARAALADAVAARPPFPPAFRARLAEVLAADARPAAARRAAADELATTAKAAGDPALAAELLGRAALWEDDAAAAVALLTESVALTKAPIPAADDAPEPHLALAVATLAGGDEAGFVEQCRRLIARFPAFDEAYATLHVHYAARGESAEADQVLAAWERAWPDEVVNAGAALARAQDRLAADQPEAAELALADLERSDPSDPNLLAALDAIYQRTNRPDALAARLQTCLGEGETLGPTGLYHAGLRLARTYVAQGKRAEAARALGQARAAAAGEPDRLYPLAALYATVGDPAAADQVLREVVDLDPSATPALVDLALAWAEIGRNLGRAEALARTAVDREPADPRALAALGWVLYKQGRPEQAREPLARAVALADTAAGPRKPARVDPAILDHLGDVLYRLGDRDGAGRAWDHCRRRLADDDLARAARDDLPALRLTLSRKLQQLRDGQPVQVSAVAPAAAVPTP
jgi:predicted Zn-dependent protease